VDAIAKVAPELEHRARKLAKDAATDPVAEGMLRQMLADRRIDSSTTTTTTIVTRDGKTEAPWLAPAMPGSENQ